MSPDQAIQNTSDATVFNVIREIEIWRVTTIPGMGFPARRPRVTRLDFGLKAENGVATTLPPRQGAAYPHFVPSVDPDGNERSGIRLPDVTVPLATYTGWNLRHPQIGAPERLMSVIGSTIPFPSTEGERAAKGDPRPSIAARYPGKTAYFDQVGHAAQCLIDAGYLLPEDLERILAQSAHRWDCSQLSRNLPLRNRKEPNSSMPGVVRPAA